MDAVHVPGDGQHSGTSESVTWSLIPMLDGHLEVPGVEMNPRLFLQWGVHTEGGIQHTHRSRGEKIRDKRPGCVGLRTQLRLRNAVSYIIYIMRY